VRSFARNTLCALAGAGVKATPDTLLDTILDPKVKLAISTPRADPSGDYAWQLFANAEKVKPGAQKALESKALQLTGGPQHAPPPKDRTVYGMIVAKGEADIFLTYCTNAILARKEEPQLQVIAIPETLNVGADYGLVVMKGSRAAGGRFADFLLSADGQKILGASGFAPPR
jgi:ABC-type molybdate transport system substrate-binding protein